MAMFCFRFNKSNLHKFNRRLVGYPLLTPARFLGFTRQTLPTTFRPRFPLQRNHAVKYHKHEKPSPWNALIFTTAASAAIFVVAAGIEDHRYKTETQWVQKWSPVQKQITRYDKEQRLYQQIEFLESLHVPKELQRAWKFCYREWHSCTDSQKTILPIIAINVMVFGMWQLRRLQPLMRRYFMHDPLSGRSITLLTSFFSHKDAWHVGLNMVALYSLSDSVYHAFGREQFLAFYLTSGLWASLISHGAALKLLHRSKISPSLGASGAIFACFSSYAIHNPDASVYFIFFPFFPIKIIYAIPFAMGIDILGIVNKWKMFDHWAHLAGTTFGLCYMKYGKQYIWEPVCQFLSSSQSK